MQPARGIVCRRQLKPHGCRRTVRGRRCAAEENTHTPTGLGRKLQPPQALAVGIVDPGEHRAANTGAQGLLDCPQGVGTRTRVNEQHVIEVHAATPERRRVRNVGRRHECQPALVLGKARKRGQQQPQLADPGTIDENFRERALWPAAVEGVVEFPIAGGEPGRRRSRPSAPDIGTLHDVFEVHRSFCWRITPTPIPSITIGVRCKSISIGSNSGFSGSNRTI